MTTTMPIIHGTTKWEYDVYHADHWGLGRVCPDCLTRIGNKATRCKPCAQRMHNKIKGQVARLLARAKQRRVVR